MTQRPSAIDVTDISGALARHTGAKGRHAAPITAAARVAHYRRQSGGKLTPRQTRRIQKKIRSRHGDIG
jgi:hypothetical protein